MKDNVYTLKYSRQIEGVRVGRIVKIDEDGQVFVNFTGNISGAMPARLTGSVNLRKLRESDPPGREVLLAFENNDSNLPIIIDTMHSPLDDTAEAREAISEAESPKDVLIDGERITFDAAKEIVLRCGKSSITLTRSGKVLIRGAYLSSRSSGSNRIKGKSVQVN
jgi:hypothetical protein